MKRLLLVLLLLVGFVGIVLAQSTPTGKINVVGVPDKFKAANAGQKTTGLKSVGIGERVVLAPFAYTGTGYNSYSANVTSAAWSFTSVPGGSAAVIMDTTTGGNNGLYVYFVPDVIGSYVVSMTAVSDSGVTPPATITITAGTYKGIGIWQNGAITSFQCGPCHSSTAGKWGEWLATNHASVMPRRLDEVGGHFGNSCLPCHTVGYNTAATAVNNGFDDLKTALGWNVPPNGPGVFDSTVTNFPTMMALGGIQCEDCHGPAGQHATTGNKALLDKSLSSEVCAPCHFSSDRHPKGYSWAASAHARSMSEGTRFNYTNRASCSPCHVGQGFIEVMIKKPAGYPPLGRTYDNPAPITCTVCHDPHSDENPLQLRRNSVADACTGCHTTRFSGQSGLHHAHQGQLLIGAEGTPFSAALPTSGFGDWTGWELPGYTYENSSHSAIEERCVTCHMARTPTYDPTYATPDTLLNKVGGHTFKIKYDNDTPADSTDDILNHVGCIECHGIVTLEYVELSQHKIKELLAELKALLPLRTSGALTGEPKFPQDNTLTTLQKAASYNYYFVWNDGSYGTHNFLYAKGLLESSIEQVALGAGAADIVSIKDVPYDQGKQVQVVWNKFPAEDFSFEKLTTYGIWRMDPLQAEAKFQAVKNFREMMAAGPVGTQVSMSGYVWSYVASVPASKLTQYAYNAPTFMDSTIAMGSYNSIFYIAGYTGAGAALYASVPDTGYSLDNLNPNTPAGLSGEVVTNGVRLSWTPNLDPDIDYYWLYRGTTPGALGAPMAKVEGAEYLDQTASSGNTYYYALVAVDDAGNQSIKSPEVAILVTGVIESNAIPTVFALRQNYPNPFNPATEIAFALPRQSTVKLEVYAISGALVTTLVDGTMPAGNFKVTWNGRDSEGRPLSSGLYLYRLDAGDFKATKKMVLLK